jgi:hypothetical protein
MYTVYGSVAVLCCRAVIVKIPNKFINDEYADMHFVCSFCNENGWAVTVKWRQRYPLRRIPHRKTFENVHRTFNGTGSFPRASAGRERRRGDDVLAAVQRSLSASTRRLSRRTGVADTGYGEFCTVVVSIRITSKEYNTSYR